MNLKDWHKAINSRFGAVHKSDCRYFGANILAEPPIIRPDPPDGGDHFTFREIATEHCKSENHAETMLMKNIESYINAMIDPKDTSKAAIIWRIEPEVSRYKDPEINDDFWQGYARLKVLQGQLI